MVDLSKKETGKKMCKPICYPKGDPPVDEKPPPIQGGGGSKKCETLTAQCSESECKEYCIEKKRKAHAACNVSDDQLCILPKMAKGAKQNATFVCQVSALCM